MIRNRLLDLVYTPSLSRLMLLAFTSMACDPEIVSNANCQPDAVYNLCSEDQNEPQSGPCDSGELLVDCSDTFAPGVVRTCHPREELESQCTSRILCSYAYDATIYLHCHVPVEYEE